MQDKRGISAIVVTALIILITVAGVAIIWFSLMPIVEKIYILESCDTNLKIMLAGYTVYDLDENYALVQIRRGSDDEQLLKVFFMFSVQGNIKTFSSEEVPNPNGKKTYFFDMNKYAISGEPEFLSVAPLVLINDKEFLLDITDEVEMPIKKISIEIDEARELYPEPIMDDEETFCSYGEIFIDGVCFVEILECSILSEAGKTYTLTANIIGNSLTDDCIKITSQNITLDCAGYYISSSNAVSGVYSDQLNTTIKNCNISMASYASSGQYGIGIELQGANNSYIFNNTLNKQAKGVYMSSTFNTTIENNTVNFNYIPSYGGVDGIAIDYSDNNNITGNTINNNSCGYNCNPYGISISYSNNNNIKSNSIDNTTCGGSGCTAYGIAVYSSDNNNITDIDISNSEDYDVNLGSSSTNNIFLNASYSSENVGAGSFLIRKWYYQAYVNDGSNPVLGATVEGISSETPLGDFSLFTDSNGLTSIDSLIEYVNDGLTKTYYSDYIITASKGEQDDTHSLTVIPTGLISDSFTIV